MTNETKTTVTVIVSVFAGMAALTAIMSFLGYSPSSLRASEARTVTLEETVRANTRAITDLTRAVREVVQEVSGVSEKNYDRISTLTSELGSLKARIDLMERIRSKEP